MNFFNLTQIESWSPQEWCAWTDEQVRSTEALNADEAIFSIRATSGGAAHWPKLLRLLAKMEVDEAPLAATLDYRTEAQHFTAVPVLTAPSMTVRSLRVEAVDWADEELREMDADRQLLTQHSLLFEKAFPRPQDGSHLVFATRNGPPLTYTSPIQGTAVPLWAIGGVAAPNRSLNSVESLFATPRLKPGHPTEIDILTVPLTKVLEKDPLFLGPKSGPFVAITENAPPWNFVQSIEAGEAHFQADGFLWQSTQVERSSSSKELILITFEQISL